MNETLKSAAEELFWLGFAAVLAWYSAVNWPLSGTLSTWKFTLLYLPFTALIVYMVKESFFRFNRIAPLLVFNVSAVFGLISIFILYMEYSRQFFREQIPSLSEAIKVNDIMNIWAISAKQAPGQPYFLGVVVLLVVVLAISALRTGYLLPRNR